MRGRVLVVLVALVALVGGACGDDGGGSAVADARPVLDAGLVDQAGLEQDTGLTWEEADDSDAADDTGDDADLPACEQLTTVGAGALEDVVAEEGSATFAGDLPGGPTVTSAIVRSSVMVYDDDTTAGEALEEIDPDLVVACITPSVTADAVGDIEVDEGPAPGSGDQAVALTSVLDDFVFFGGNDNSHRLDLVAARSGSAVVVVELVASSQSFDGVEVASVAEAVLAGRVTAMEDAQ